MTDVEIFPIFPSSPQLATKKSKHNFPFKSLECGQSFSIPKEYIKIETLRPMCSLQGKQLRKRFKIVVHEDVFEVGRVK